MSQCQKCYYYRCLYLLLVKNKIIATGGIIVMKKSLISMICFTLLVSFFCSTSQVHAVNFEGQEDKYMKLCSSKSLSNSNYNTCKQFNSYLKKKTISYKVLLMNLNLKFQILKVH